MSDFDLDKLLADAVDEYRQHTLDRIKPVGAGTAQATAAHRKRVHAMALSVLVAALVIAPISVYAAVDHDHNGPPHTSASRGVVPSASPLDTPSSPLSGPSTEGSPATVTVKPITEYDLANATLHFPTTGSWGKPCPQGTVVLANGHYVGLSGVASSLTDPFSGLIKVVQVDLDHNGTPDAAAIFGCHVGDPAAQTAIGFRRAANGSIETIGTIENGGDIKDIVGEPNGSVRIIVTNQTGSDNVAVAKATPQSRSYGWNGTRFTQTAGSTSFTVRQPGLSVQLSDVIFSKPTSGQRTGTMTVSLHNGGSRPISLAAIVYVFGSFTKTSPSCTSLLYGPSGSGRCQVPLITVGATVAVTFHFTDTDSDLSYFRAHPSLAASGSDLVQIDIGDQQLLKQPTLGNVVLK